MEQLTFQIPPNKFVRCDGDFNDRISALSDDLLVCILSSLPLKEAARTSVLSRRWQHLWQFSTGSFNFDATKIIWNIKSETDDDTAILKKERRRYIEWVNQVLDLHQASTIDEFRICFDLHIRSKHYIDKWLDFAFRKRVKKLELDFTHIDCYDYDIVYTFPRKYFSCNPFPPGIKFLTSLCLQNVNVTNKLLKSFLSNCPQLERLRVVNTETLTKLNVSGSPLSMKHLHISLCRSIKRITVSAPNLVSFEYFGKKPRLRLRYAPQLRNVFYGCEFNHRVAYGLHRILSFLSQLVTLKISLSPNWGKLPKFPELSCLRHLTYHVWVADGRDLLGLTSLIEASPALEKFKLECQLHDIGRKREVQKVEGYPNKNLKEVEVVGFFGGTSDTELIIYLLESAFNLEKIVIDPCPLLVRGTPWEFIESEGKQRARKFAHQLKKSQANKGSVEFVIL